jgi:hypothetical protein
LKIIWGVFAGRRVAAEAVTTLRRVVDAPGAINVVLAQDRGAPALPESLAALLADCTPLVTADAGTVLLAGRLAEGLMVTAIRPLADEGGLYNAFLQLGLPPGYARAYVDGVRAGAVLLAARVADERERETVTLLRQRGVTYLGGLAGA